MRLRNLVFLLGFAPRDSAVVVERCLGNRLAPECGGTTHFLVGHALGNCGRLLPPCRSAEPFPLLRRPPERLRLLGWGAFSDRTHGQGTKHEATQKSVVPMWEGHRVPRFPCLRNPRSRGTRCPSHTQEGPQAASDVSRIGCPTCLVAPNGLSMPSSTGARTRKSGLPQADLDPSPASSVLVTPRDHPENRNVGLREADSGPSTVS
jgi:hypothetical protein